MPAYFFLRLIVELFRFVPFPVLYRLSDGLAFVLYRIVGYRKQVIFENLRRSFPEKTESQIRQIAHGAYRNLTDVTLETIKSHTSPLNDIRRRCLVLNPEIINAYLDKGQSLILAGSHTGNWEYAGLVMPGALHNRLYGVYKPLTNKVVNAYTNRKRARGGIGLMPMEEAVSVMRKQKNTEAWAYMLISDQSPSSRKRAHWVEFFGQETASLPGVDVLSRTFVYPVFTYQIKRIRRGYYTIEYAALCMDPAALKEGDITRAYTLRLEEEIRTQPENWLWSHKRWKMRREA